MNINRQTEIENKVWSLCKEWKLAAQDAIEPVTKWLVADATIDSRGANICLMLATDKTKRLDLTYYGRHCSLFPEYRGQLRTNIGAFGSFNTIAENDIAEYYMQVGILISNKDMLGYLIKIAEEFTGYIHESEKEYRALSKKED